MKRINMGGREILYLFNLHHPSSSNLIFDLPELKKMGIPAELRDAWVSRRQSSSGSVPVASAHENRSTVKGLTFLCLLIFPVFFFFGGFEFECISVGCRSGDCR